MRKISRIDFLVLAVMGLLVGGVYWPQWFFGQTAVESPHMRDIVHFWYPYYGAIARSYQSGTLPLWESFNLFGSPLAGITYAGILYFPNLICLATLDYMVAIPLGVGLHSWLAAGLMYGFLRRSGVSPVSGFIVGLSYPLTGIFFAANNHPCHLYTFTWLPLVYWAYLDIMERPRLRGLLVLGFAAWMMALAGEVEAFTYHLVGLFLFMVFTGRIFSDNRRLKSTAVVFLGLVISWLLIQPSFLSSLEMLHHSIRNPQFGMDIHFTSFIGDRYSLLLPLIFFPLDHLKNVFPFDMFNHGLSPMYPGIIIISMFLMAVRYFGRDPEIRLLFYWFLSVLVMAFFLLTPWFEPWLKLLPVVGSMANRFKWIEVIQFAMLILAAKGIDEFQKELKEKIPGPAIILAFLWGAGIILVLRWSAGGIERVALSVFLILIGVVLLVFRSRNRTVLPKQMAWIFVLIFLADIYSLSLRCVPRTPLEDFRAPGNFVELLKRVPANDRPRFLALEGVFHPDLSPEITGLLQNQARSDSITTRIRLPLFRPFQLVHEVFPWVLRENSEGKLYYDALEIHNPGLLSIKSMQLINLTAVRYLISRRYSLKFSSPYHLLKPEALPSPPKHIGGVRFADDPASPGVIMDYPSRLGFMSTAYKNSKFEIMCDGTLSPKAGFLQVVLKDVPGEKTHLMLSRAFNNTANTLCSGTPFEVDLNRIEQAQYEYQISALPLGLSGGQVVLNDLRIVRPDAPLQEMARIPGVYINRQALPRAYVVHRAQVIESEPDLLARVLDPARFDPKESVVFSRTDPTLRVMDRLQGQWPWQVREQVKIQSYDMVSARFSVKMDGPGYLVLSDAYYPGWRVWVNGAEQNIIRANYAFRAVFLDHGQNRVVFKYVPASFRIGWWVMIASLAMIGIVVLTRRFGRSR